MARFDAHGSGRSQNLLLNCQADLLELLSTRFVIPLIPLESDPQITPRLNPIFELRGVRYVLATQLALSIEVGQLGPRIGSLIEHEYDIGRAIDILLGGV